MPKIGHGFDAHRLTQGRRLVLGGVDIPFDGKGLLGHSDADVLLHAICDALLGAVALGDIGKHFPDSDEKYKNVSGITLLEDVCAKVKKSGYIVGNIDTTIVAEAPKLAPYIESMRKNIAQAVGADIGSVSVKATTTEGMGFTGRGEGIAAYTVVLLVEM
ncbi:2-C-methyl-D-erythritol 2,4-cyclodiphosphate synthase [hydrothermal vent metagenome]|uniref:2-C-methyl-D-erythritol 2,4-cyclodiphosphate synthase n=1 Tax=hydrothermal vent metagenome TaxID=652676 RepID=A0A3B1BP24_9ZZZZ